MVGLVILLLLVVALGVSGVILALKVRAAQREEDSRQAALHAARQEAINLTSLNYKTLDHDMNLVLDGATGTFKDQYATQTKELQAVLPKAKVTSSGSVLEAGVTSMDSDSAQVLVVADSTVKNSAVPKGVLRHYRMRIDLDREGDRWLVSKLEFVP